MTLAQLFRRIVPYVKPFRLLLVATLSLTLVGSLLAQVNAVVLDRTVDAINALVFGNEVYGVQQDVVDACDLSLEIPQYGTKHSLNVSVSVGVVLWEMVRG